MGASGWDYRVPYQPEVAEALSDLQNRVFDEGGYHEYWDEWPGVLPQPQTIEDVWAAKDTDAFWETGTHSILDIDKIAAVTEPDSPGAIRAMSAEEIQDVLGTDRPTLEDFEQAVLDGGGDFDFPGWSGRYVILFKDGKPNEIAFWGFSGD